MFKEEILELQRTHDNEMATNKPNSKITMAISARMMGIYDLLEKSSDYIEISKLRACSPHFDGLVQCVEELLKEKSESPQ